MKKLGMLSLIVGSLWLGACSDDDKDFMLDVNRMTGVDWYYNRTTSKNYLSFSDENVLEIKPAFATGVPPYIYAFHRYTWNSTLPFCTQV